MSNNGVFLFRKTLVEPLGSTIYEFPYHFAANAWPLILEERTDFYETVSITIDRGAVNKKSHVARIVELFDDTVTHVGKANIKPETIVTVRVHKGISGNRNQQPMQLLVKPRSFEFHTHVGMTEVSKILLSHDPLVLDAIVLIDKRIQKGPVPLRELRNAYRAALLDFVESERIRLNSLDSVRSTDLRAASVTVQLIQKGTPQPQPQSLQQPLQQTQTLQTPLQQQQSMFPQHMEQGSPVQFAPPDGPNMYPITSPTSTMYAPVQNPVQQPAFLAQSQHQQQQGGYMYNGNNGASLGGGGGGGVPVQLQTNFYQQQQQQQQQAALEARRKDQPPAPLLQPGLSQTSMYYEMGQYGAAATQNNSASLPPDFFTSA